MNIWDILEPPANSLAKGESWPKKDFWTTEGQVVGGGLEAILHFELHFSVLEDASKIQSMTNLSLDSPSTESMNE